MYIVTNRITGQVTTHKTLKSASAKCEKYAQNYGALCATYCYKG